MTSVTRASTLCVLVPFVLTAIALHVRSMFRPVRNASSQTLPDTKVPEIPAANGPRQSEKGQTIPTFFIHFGPMKTGSTTTQHSLEISHKLLQSTSSYRYVGRKTGYVETTSYPNLYDWDILTTPKGSKQLSATLLSHLRKGNNPIFSYECLSNYLYSADDKKEGNKKKFENMVSLIDSVRQDGFRVKPVAVYRRLFSWVPSYHAEEVYRFENPECRVSMIRWFDLHDETWDCTHNGTFIDQHPTQKLVDRLKSHLGLDDIAIVNLHRMTPDDEGDVFHHFVREVLPGSETFLKKFGEQYVSLPMRTSSGKIPDFQHLATAVALIGRITNVNDSKANVKETGAARKDAARKMSKKKDEIVKLFGGEDNIPTLCFSDDQLARLLGMSLEFEKELFPEWFAMDGTERDHRNEFQEYVDRGKFCEWDVEKMLQKRALRDFIKSNFERMP